MCGIVPFAASSTGYMRILEHFAGVSRVSAKSYISHVGVVDAECPISHA